MAETHKHILVTGYIDVAPGADAIDNIKQWFVDLVAAVDMNILIQPNVVWCDTEGNEGITGIVVIDTSHSSIHIWNTESPFFKFDLYSCKDFDVDTVMSMLRHLGTYKAAYTVVDRTDDSHPIIESGTIDL